MPKRLQVCLLLAVNNFCLIVALGMLETAILQFSLKYIFCASIFALIWWITSSFIFVKVSETVTKINSNDEVKNE